MLPNQNNKLSTESIVRQSPKIEIEIETEEPEMESSEPATSEIETVEVPEGYHVMPDGTMMADSEHEMEDEAASE